MTTRRLGARVMQPVPASPCPRCYTILSCATGIAETPEAARPHPGGVTICDQCATWLVFDARLQLRVATAEEIDAVDPEMRAAALRVLGFLDAQRRRH